ncbi:MAG: hypothetical protein QOF11_1443 [Chloroflexota bacterium]|nr:hypothetical protein [Chloroflexota bacterium]
MGWSRGPDRRPLVRSDDDDSTGPALTDPNDRDHVVGEYPDEAYPYEPDSERPYRDQAYQLQPEVPEIPARRPRRTITPLRVTLGIALLVSLAVVGYGLVARDATQLPMLTAGEFISGIVFALLALAGAWAAYSQSREGSAGRALVYAVGGGIAALLAAASLAAAIILALTLSS